MMLLRLEQNIQGEPKAICRHNGLTLVAIVSEDSIESGVLSLLDSKERSAAINFLENAKF